MSTANAAHRKMEWLEAMRGFAAIWVLLHHAKQSVDHFVGDMGARPILANGYLGVDFFFVLSGFIIAFASHRLADRGGGIREYARARMMRIYIPYLPVGVAIFLLYLVLPSLSEGGRSPGALTSFTLIPSNSPPALSVAWTLVHEIIFYTIYALRFVHRALFRGVFAVWVASILGVAAMDIEMPLAARYFLSPLNLCFVLGVLIFHVNARVQGRQALAIACAVCGLLMVGSQAMLPESNRIVVALGFAALVWAAASPSFSGLPVWRPLVVLGATSYAIYLIHNPALSILVRLLPAGTSIGVAYAAIAVGALAAGLLYWRLYERPALTWVRLRVTGADQNGAPRG